MSHAIARSVVGCSLQMKYRNAATKNMTSIGKGARRAITVTNPGGSHPSSTTLISKRNRDGLKNTTGCRLANNHGFGAHGGQYNGASEACLPETGPLPQRISTMTFRSEAVVA